MRLSSPMPRATSCTSAPTFSPRSAISLMKVILVARKALAAYLISSAVRRAGEHDRRLVEGQRPVDLAHHLARALVVGADHDAVGELEVADRRALAQEFRIGDDRDVGRRLGLADDPLDLVAGADRHGRFGDDHGEAVERGGDLARGGVDIGEVGMAVAAPRRRADRDEHRVGFAPPAPARSVVKISRPGLHVGGHQLVEARLEDRDLAALQRCDLAGVLVDAGDLVAEIGKAGAGHQADIARADHRDAHEDNPYLMVNARSRSCAAS